MRLTFEGVAEYNDTAVLTIAAKARKSGKAHQVKMTCQGHFIDDLPGQAGKGKGLVERQHSDQIGEILKDPAVQTALDDMRRQIAEKKRQEDVARSLEAFPLHVDLLLENGVESAVLKRMIDECEAGLVMKS